MCVLLYFSGEFAVFRAGIRIPASVLPSARSINGGATHSDTPAPSLDSTSSRQGARSASSQTNTSRFGSSDAPRSAQIRSAARSGRVNGTEHASGAQQLGRRGAQLENVTVQFAASCIASRVGRAQAARCTHVWRIAQHRVIRAPPTPVGGSIRARRRISPRLWRTYCCVRYSARIAPKDRAAPLRRLYAQNLPRPALSSDTIPLPAPSSDALQRGARRANAASRSASVPKR